MKFSHLLAVIAGVFILQSCKQEKNYQAFTHDPVLYSRTVKKLNDIVLENNFPPVIASRNYVYANIAAYEVVAAGYDSAYQSLAGQVKDLPAVPKWSGGAIDYPLAALLAFTIVGNAVTFPEGSMMEYHDYLLKEASKQGMSDEMIANSKAYGEKVSAHIMAWAKKDNYAQTRSAEKYTVLEEDGRWVPTPPMYAQGMEAHWKEIRPLVLDSSSVCKPPPPPKFDIKDTTSVYYKNLMIVKKNRRQSHRFATSCRGFLGR